MTAKTKYSISALPLAPSALLVTHNLTPDPTQSLETFRTKYLKESPSFQRRARLLSPESHFSYVTPFPVAFPYEIEAPIDPPSDSGSYIEHWLSAREATNEQPPTSSGAVLRKYTPDPQLRNTPRELIGLSETGLRDCVPHLDVGDAFKLMGVPALVDAEDPEKVTADPVAQDLIDVLSGHAVLMSPEDSSVSFAPWSLRYSGHQFGTWAGQLGDGRATSILVTPHPDTPGLTYELQLKGAGRTPFSRSADGLAVLRSSVREYLCSEAMYALGIPTTRSLALISLPNIPVARERMETACVLTRVAPSFLRIGSFEALSPPRNQFIFGGGQQKADLEALRVLGVWVASRVLALPGEDSGDAWGKRLVLEVARRNAQMVAGWQAYGFMHGVINTDNVSILGLTIDYGPYAFMDVFDSFHICNHTDQEGRYAYKYQPNMIIFALRALLNALAPLIGAELANGGRALAAGWADDIDADKIAEWTKAGAEAVREELDVMVQAETARTYGNLMRKRLGLRREESTDEPRLFKPLLDLMAEHGMDFHGTFRTLARFRPGWMKEEARTASVAAEDNADAPLAAFLARLLAQAPDQERLDRARASKELIAWLEVYTQRVEGEAEEWTTDDSTKDQVDVDEQRERAALAANPRFVLRQWVLEEVISRVEADAVGGRRVLAKVLHMASNPFEAWGGEDEEGNEADLEDEVKEERRFCGLGEKKMLGFQCSCSS